MPSIQAKMISGLFKLIGVNKMLMHCWGAMEFVPEARAVRQEYFKALQ